MRVPYPERIPYTWAAVFSAGLLAIQLLERTEVQFAFCCFAFIMVATTAFNLAGGLFRPAGAYVFFNATLTVILGVLAKAYFGEPADSNLGSPLITIEVYLLGMVGILVAAFVEARFRPDRSFISRVLPVISLRGVYLGALLTGLSLTVFWLSAPRVTSGTLLSALRNGDQLLPFAIILGVMHTVRATNGKRSTSLAVLVLMTTLIALGTFSFTKQGLITPLFCWMIGAGISRYRLKTGNYFVLGTVALLVAYVLVPIVQLGKGGDRGNNLSENITIVMRMLRNFNVTRQDYLSRNDEEYSAVNYFNKSEGLLDRLQMVSVDDLLITETQRDGFFGYEPFIEGWENVIPHFLWPDKPVPYFGNLYAHQLGILSDDDPTTGVSFSPSADSYKMGGFPAVLIMEPFCFIVIFLCFSFVAGDVREHPSAILMVLIVAHAGPEGMIPGAILLVLQLVFVVAFAVFCRFIAPVVTSAVIPLPNPKFGELVSAVD